MVYHAYTLLHHLKRIPAEDRSKIEAAIPTHIRFMNTLLNSNESTESATH